MLALVLAGSTATVRHDPLVCFESPLLRPLFAAVDTWQLADVDWMLKDDKAVDASVNDFMEYYNATADRVSFFQLASALKTPSLKDDELFNRLGTSLQELQASTGNVFGDLSRHFIY